MIDIKFVYILIHFLRFYRIFRRLRNFVLFLPFENYNINANVCTGPEIYAFDTSFEVKWGYFFFRD